MAVFVINPNSTVPMTEAMVSEAKRAAPGLTFEGWTSHDGPASIQGAADGQRATAPLLKLVETASEQGAEAIIIGCFDDTALAAAASRASCPVIGIGQAAYHYAALRQWRFSVVTTMQVSVPVLQDNIGALGLGRYLARVRASDVPVLALETGDEDVTRQVLETAQTAVDQDGVDAIILGCAGMVHVTAAVRRAVDVAVIDPVACAAACCFWLVTGNTAEPAC